jgi:hypothetical protein
VDKLDKRNESWQNGKQKWQREKDVKAGSKYLLFILEGGGI